MLRKEGGFEVAYGSWLMLSWWVGWIRGEVREPRKLDVLPVVENFMQIVSPRL